MLSPGNKEVLSGLKASRRDVLKSMGALSALGMIGCSGDGAVEYFGNSDAEDYAPPVPDESGAKWIYPYCTFGCGGPCLNAVLVKDGVILRHGTDNNNPDDPTYQQYRTCVKGRALRKGYYAADRLRYPMKRKSWQPGGGVASNGDKRGSDTWERITWDQAYQYIYDEFTRIINDPASKGIKSIATPRCNSSFLTKLGGAFTPNAYTSEGARPMVLQAMQGDTGVHTSNSDKMQYFKTKLLILFGFNPAWTCNNQINMLMQDVKKAGVKFIVIDPMLTHSSAVLADQWIPIRPGTDAAFLIGAAHYMITNNLHDQAFLDKYTVGFDSAHMPAGTPPGTESFKDYVLGIYDGKAKTPDWASEICGVPADIIKQFAQEAAVTKPAMWQASTSPCRTYLGEQFTQAFLTVGWMTGNVGKEGAAVSHGYGRMMFQSSFYSIGTSRLGAPNLNATKVCHHEELYDAILNKEYTSGIDTITKQPKKTACDIRAVYSVAGGSKGDFINQFRGVHRGIKALKKLDIIVVNDIFMSPLAQYADIVLPDTSHWERGPQFHTSYKPDVMFYSEKVSEPFFEARNGAVVDYELSVKFGQPTTKVDMEQSFFDSLYTTKTRDLSGGEMPLVTFTQSDLDSFGTKAAGKTPQYGLVALEELRLRGMYTHRRRPGDKYDFIAQKMFIDDPVANPLPTTTGKMEIYCPKLVDDVNGFGFNIDMLPPIPKYRPIKLGYEETFSDYANKVKGSYPFQLYNFRRLNSGHSTIYNIENLKAIMPHNVYINADDAKSKGIAHGDIALISSPVGKMIMYAYVTERIMPGVVALGEGGWFNLAEENGELIDTGGSVNLLSDSLPSSTNVPYHANVNVEKYAGILTPDCNWKPIVPVAE